MARKALVLVRIAVDGLHAPAVRHVVSVSYARISDRLFDVTRLCLHCLHVAQDYVVGQVKIVHRSAPEHVGARGVGGMHDPTAQVERRGL